MLELSCAAAAFFDRRRRFLKIRKAAMAMAIRKAIPMPAPMPTFAPVDKPSAWTAEEEGVDCVTVAACNEEAVLLGVVDSEVLVEVEKVVALVVLDGSEALDVVRLALKGLVLVLAGLAPVLDCAAVVSVTSLTSDEATGASDEATDEATGASDEATERRALVSILIPSIDILRSHPHGHK